MSTSVAHKWWRKASSRIDLVMCPPYRHASHYRERGYSVSAGSAFRREPVRRKLIALRPITPFDRMAPASPISQPSASASAGYPSTSMTMRSAPSMSDPIRDSFLAANFERQNGSWRRHRRAIEPPSSWVDITIPTSPPAAATSPANAAGMFRVAAE